MIGVIHILLKNRASCDQKNADDHSNKNQDIRPDKSEAMNEKVRDEAAEKSAARFVLRAFKKSIDRAIASDTTVCDQLHQR